jgi:nucleoside-diphosphate-sugar epimerase
MRLLTGFPGFLGTEFIDRILRKTDAQFLCLVQSKFLNLANLKLEELEKRNPGVKNRIHLIEGDITVAGLQITNPSLLTQVEQVYHFAAVYDLNVSEAIGKRINVDGTRNILDLLPTLPHLKRFHYVSTCYVSGRTSGPFLETDLIKGQSFNNFYESTKYEAELLVREKMNSGLPATIYRPSIVVGDSHTGETQKYDGPYFVVQWLLRQGKYAILPQLGDPTQYSINLVPSNFVIDAMAYLSEKPESIGKTFQLADPNPLTIAEVVHTLAKACGKNLIEIPLPKGLAKFAVGKIPGLENWLGIPRSSLDYFVHPTQYDVSETTKQLEGSGLQCPPFSSYAEILVEYMKSNPEVRNKALT